MTYGRARDLLDLAAFVASHRFGVPYEGIRERFGVGHRQAQRMVGELRDAFPELEERVDESRRKVFVLRREALRDLTGVTAAQLAALDQAIVALGLSGQDAGELMRLRDRIGAVIPDPDARRIGPDLDVLLEAQGFVARPGPRQAIEPALQEAVIAAVLGCRAIAFDYASGSEPDPTSRLVEPYGILSGLRRYLVGRPVGGTEKVRKYRMDKMSALRVIGPSFVRPTDFDLHAYAARGFGAFVDEGEYGEVAWRFSPEAAERARGWSFHPDQELAEEADGSLVVRFRASGHLEMCWHLYAWGDKVEVLAPEALRRMVEGHRRPDFGAMP